MITNERQYKITKAQAANFRIAFETFNLKEAIKRTSSPKLAKAELDALKSELDKLARELLEYENLKSGNVRLLKANSLSSLPDILIKARIAKGLTQQQLAKLIGVKEQQIQRYEAEGYFSANLHRLEVISNALELDISEVAEFRSSTNPEAFLKPDIDWSNFPVEEMYKRNWFENFNESLTIALENLDITVKNFINNAIPSGTSALLRNRIRSNSNMDYYALLAWQCRILSLAKKRDLKSQFNHNVIQNSWLTKLVQLSVFDDGPRRAVDYLDNYGICLVIEPQLSRTYLDGAAFVLPNGTPVLGLTLRYDRLDNFWFVLFHELAHLKLHLRKGHSEDVFFDDLDAKPNDIEHEADHFAGEALIPSEAWEVSIARYVRSEDSINDLAKQLNISPAIIAGKIRNEANNYIILNHLVGQGAVRKHFPNVVFG